MRADRVGLYVHIPFCVRKCNYCDFCSFSDISQEQRELYITRLCEEIKSYKKEPRTSVSTVFFGGGTPSLLEPCELSKICDAIYDSFLVCEGAEFTVEVNPKTLNAEKCRAYKKLGVNRISIGLQSIHENELKKLGRIHTFSDFLDSYRLASEYFDNISVDLMYGIPEQTKASLEATLDTVLALEPKHISAYGLIVEEGTPFYKMRRSLPLPTEDEEYEMYLLIAEKLLRSGYSHYEISNYAKAGYKCRHNLIYWRDEQYIGVGLAAASYFGERFINTKNLDEYLYSSGANYIREYETPDCKTEYIMLNLRLSDGISLTQYMERFGEDFLLTRSAVVEKFKKHGYLECDSDRLSLTEKGFYVSNSIISELI